MKKIVSIILAAVMVLAFAAACSTAKVEGKYVVKSIDGKGILDYIKEEAELEGVDLETILSMMGLTEETISELMTVELKEDKTAVMTMIGEENETGTWKLDGNKVTITSEDGESAEFTYNNGELTYKMTEGEESHEMVLVKVPAK